MSSIRCSCFTRFSDLTQRNGIGIRQGNENDEFAGMTINDTFYKEKEDAGKAILEMCKNKQNADNEVIGEYNSNYYYK